MTRTRTAALFASLLGLAGSALVLALALGSADVGLAELGETLRGTASATTRSLILDLRLPRALSAFAVGGLLAIAGVLMQVLLRNPLAEPYILGSSGGAAVAARAAEDVGFRQRITEQDLHEYAGDGEQAAHSER